MARWELLSNDIARKTWDAALLRLVDYSPFQTYAWGQYRRALGWEPCYWAAFDENEKIVAMLLGGLRRYPLSVGLVWCEGGPIGELSTCDESLQTAMRKTTGLKRVYARFRCDRERHVEDTLRLTAQGWSRTWFPLTSGYSMSLNLKQTEEQIVGGLERNWRRNLKRSREGTLTVRQWENPNAEDAIAVFTSMQKVKNLEEQHSREEIDEVFNHLSDSLVLYRCDDEHGQLLSLLGCLVVGERAVLLLSACSELGREKQAAYAVFWELMKHCMKVGTRELDLAGIDPICNPGVYRFKRASGARPVEYLGEWDWASRPWLQWFGNWAISRRDRLLKAAASVKSFMLAPRKKPIANIAGEKVAQPKAA